MLGLERRRACVAPGLDRPVPDRTRHDPSKQRSVVPLVRSARRGSAGPRRPAPATAARRGRDDRDLQSSIRLDIVRQAHAGRHRRIADGSTGDVLDPDRTADLARSAAGLAGRTVRRAPAVDGRRSADRGELGAVRPCQQSGDAVPDLRTARRHRDRDRVRRSGRADGALVPRPSWPGHRHGGRGVRLRRRALHLPGGGIDCRLRPFAHVAVVRPDPRRRRHCGRPGDTHAAAWLDAADDGTGCRRTAALRRRRGRTADHAAYPALLAAVRDDGHDGHWRPDGRVADERVCP